jgi:hypothetical protein
MPGPAPDDYVPAAYPATDGTPYLAMGGNPYLLREVIAADMAQTSEGIVLDAPAIANSLVPRLAGYGPHVVALTKAVAPLDLAGVCLAAAITGLDTKVAMGAERLLAEDPSWSALLARATPVEPARG